MSASIPPSGSRRTVWYVINLDRRTLIATHEGAEGSPPPVALKAANDVTQMTGESCVCAQGIVWTQLP